MGLVTFCTEQRCNQGFVFLFDRATAVHQWSALDPLAVGHTPLLRAWLVLLSCIDPPLLVLAMQRLWLEQISTTLSATAPKCRNTRIRYPLKSVVDSLKASFKIATTRGSPGRLASIFLVIKRFNTRTCSALMLDFPFIGCALLICTLCRLIWLSCDNAFSGDNMHGQACAELQLNAHVFHHCEIWKGG